PTDGPMKRNRSTLSSAAGVGVGCCARPVRTTNANTAASIAALTTADANDLIDYLASTFLTTNQTLAGRSAKRRMYHGNQYSPYAMSTRTRRPSFANRNC